MQTHDLSPLATYRRFLDEGKLAYQYDPVLDRPVFPPRVLAPRSGSTDLEWRISNSRGTVYACTVLYPKNQDAYNVVLVDMDDGFRMMGRVDGIPAEDVRVGMAVTATVCDAGDGTPPYPVFVQRGDQ